jgi:hypothetical protein
MLTTIINPWKAINDPTIKGQLDIELSKIVDMPQEAPMGADELRIKVSSVLWIDSTGKYNFSYTREYGCFGEHGLLPLGRPKFYNSKILATELQ